jgi:hypothetical protein
VVDAVLILACGLLLGTDPARTVVDVDLNKVALGVVETNRQAFILGQLVAEVRQAFSVLVFVQNRDRITFLCGHRYGSAHAVKRVGVHLFFIDCHAS